jgi:hypothetical protein
MKPIIYFRQLCKVIDWVPNSDRLRKYEPPVIIKITEYVILANLLILIYVRCI